MIFQLQNTGRSLIDKITVMRNVKHRTGVLTDRFLKDFLRNNIQMVRRLVEDQEIRFGEHQTGQRDTSALTTAQIPNPFIYIVTGKKKCRQNIPNLRTGHIRVDI